MGLVSTVSDISFSGPAGTFNLRVAPDDLDGGIESGHRFCWVPVRELGSVDFRPAGLIPVLPELTSTGALRHVVLRPA
jgi:hypothetical protein